MNIDSFLDTFINGDYFIIFLILVFIILIVLVIALLKTREDYNILLEEKEKKNESNLEDNDLFGDLLAVNDDDIVDDKVPFIKQIDTSMIKTYDDELKGLESLDEEAAIISADELNEITKKREEELGPNINQAAIERYEEEQESKAIISYEQLLKNASNITLTYKEEKLEGGSPRVNKVEVHTKEVTGAEMYIKEEEFLRILKEFRVKLE